MALPNSIEYSFVNKTEIYPPEGDFTGKHQVTICTKCVRNGQEEKEEKVYTDFVGTIENGSDAQYAEALFNNLNAVICTAYEYDE